MKKYPSAVDIWLVAILVGVPLLIISRGVYFTLTRSIAIGLLGIIAGLVIGLLIALFALPCVYTLEEEKLTIRCGLISYKVPLSKIKSVEKSGSLLSAPALSIRRVKISTTDRDYVISPRDREVFIADVMARIPKEERG